MKKENEIYNLNKMEVIEVITKYINDILTRIKLLKEAEDPTLIKIFYKQIMNDTDNMKMMDRTAKEYKKDCKLTEFISQKAMNKIYKDFIFELEHFDGDDTASIVNLNNIIKSPDDYYNDNIATWMEDFKQYETFKLIGCRIEYELDQTDHDYNWTNVPHYILTVIGKWNKYYEIELYESYNVDYYVTVCGHCNLKRVNDINITHKVKDIQFFKLPRFIKGYDIRTIKHSEQISLFDEREQDVQNIIIDNIFEADYDGGDYWYPDGFVRVNMELFEEPNHRQKDKRPVWLFKGGSGLGKTYLAYLIKDGNSYKRVYDTDKDDELPDVITADVIVLGNKYDFTIEDIKSRIPSDYELIIVDFSKEE